MPDRLRIVHAVRSDGFAGVEQYVGQLAVAQDASGHEVAVIGGDPAMMARVLGGVGIRHRPAATALDVMRAVDAERRCDLLAVHMTAAEAASALAVRAWRVPVVSTRHFGLRRGRSLPARCARGLIAARVAAQIAISDYVAARIEGASTVVHTGVPSRPDAVPASARERSVLVAQRLEPEKRTEDAIRAFALAGLGDAGWRLDIAGQGSQRARLETLTTTLGISGSVHFLGRRSDVPDLMSVAGMVLATCDIEGLGLTVLEAMAAGTAVVAVAAGGHLETLGGVAEAALYQPGDLTGAGHLLAGLGASEPDRDRYGAVLQARQRAQFTIEAQAAATEAVYRSVL